MAIPSVDSFAATNPALCSLILRAFAEGYVEEDGEGVPVPLVLVPLPLVLSEAVASTLSATNSATGLLPWLARFQEVKIGMAERVARVAGFSRQALLFGLRYRVLGITPAGRVVPESAGLVKKPNFPASAEPGRFLSLAKRLGGWSGQVRSPETVLLCLGANR